MLSNNFIDDNAILHMAKHHKRKRMKGGVLFTTITNGGWSKINVDTTIPNVEIDEKINDILVNNRTKESRKDAINDFINEYIIINNIKRIGEERKKDVISTLNNYLNAREEEIQLSQEELERQERERQEYEREEQEREIERQERARIAREEAMRIMDEQIQKRQEKQEKQYKKLKEHGERIQMGEEDRLSRDTEAEERAKKAAIRLQKAYRYKKAQDVYLQKEKEWVKKINPTYMYKDELAKLTEEEKQQRRVASVEKFGKIGKKLEEVRKKKGIDTLKQRSREYIPEPHIVGMLEKTIDEYEKNIPIFNENIKNIDEDIKKYKKNIKKSGITEEDKIKYTEKRDEYIEKRDEYIEKRDKYERQLSELKNKLQYYETNPTEIGSKKTYQNIRQYGGVYGKAYENVFINELNNELPTNINLQKNLGGPLHNNDQHPHYKRIPVMVYDKTLNREVPKLDNNGNPMFESDFLPIDSSSPNSDLEFKFYNTAPFRVNYENIIDEIEKTGEINNNRIKYDSSGNDERAYYTDLNGNDQHNLIPIQMAKFITDKYVPLYIEDNGEIKLYNILDKGTLKYSLDFYKKNPHITKSYKPGKDPRFVNTEFNKNEKIIYNFEDGTYTLDLNNPEFDYKTIYDSATKKFLNPNFNILKNLITDKNLYDKLLIFNNDFSDTNNYNNKIFILGQTRKNLYFRPSLDNPLFDPRKNNPRKINTKSEYGFKKIHLKK